MRVLLTFLLVCGCHEPPFAIVTACTPNPWRTEVWISDPQTGVVEATLREGCASFPDTSTEYRIVGRRPGGSYELLFEGEVEHWERRHGLSPLPDGTQEVAVWDRRCVAAGDHFACSAIDPVARWR